MIEILNDAILTGNVRENIRLGIFLVEMTSFMFLSQLRYSSNFRFVKCIYIFYMAELAIRSVRKLTHADRLLSRTISFSYRLASFGGKISELI